jgi:hypothetical protein
MNLFVKIAAEHLMSAPPSRKRIMGCSPPARNAVTLKPARLFLEDYLSAPVEDHRLILPAADPTQARGAAGNHAQSIDPDHRFSGCLLARHAR